MFGLCLFCQLSSSRIEFSHVSQPCKHVSVFFVLFFPVINNYKSVMLFTRFCILTLKNLNLQIHIELVCGVDFVTSCEANVLEGSLRFVCGLTSVIRQTVETGSGSLNFFALHLQVHPFAHAYARCKSFSFTCNQNINSNFA